MVYTKNVFVESEMSKKLKVKDLNSLGIEFKVSGGMSIAKKESSSRNVVAHSGWRVVGGRRVYFRSKFEANYGRYLQFLKEVGQILDWEHEPKTFWFEGIKRGCVSYLPDFKVILDSKTHEWHEVKGYLDAKSKTKIKRFIKFFPEERLKVINYTWCRENAPKLKWVITEWE